MGWCKFHLFIALIKFSHILAGYVKQQQVKVLQVGDKLVKIHDKVADRPNSAVKLLSRVEQFRLFSKAEKAGCHQKEKGKYFLRVQTPNVGHIDSMYIAKVLLRRKDLLQGLLLHQNPYKYLNFIVLFLWTTRDQFLS
jgi:hypothetical protein